ncbi:MAG: hypothetical protein HYT65_03245 [Candidatus Yanofskybacteria bacterium]|nr:hypothetical protein [Candidatus Yanofskybacteria bacterium]
MGFVAIFMVGVLFLTSCGKVDSRKAYETTKETDYLVKIEVSIREYKDPVIFIKAGEIEFDKNNLKLTVKNNGFLTSVNPNGLLWDDGNYTFAIQVENNAVFSIPLGGRITIRHPNGKTEVFERFG